MMTTGLLGAALLVVAAAVTAHAAPDDTQSTFERLDHAMQRAFVTRDAKLLDSLLSDDYVLISSSSKVLSKKEVMAELVDPEVVLTVNDTSDLKARRHGDAVVVTAVLHQAGTDHGKPFDVWLRYTDTWALESGKWLYISAHASRIPGPPAESHAAAKSP